MLKGSLKRTMGKPLAGKTKQAYFGPERLPGRPDGGTAGHLQRKAFKRSHQIHNLLLLCEPCLPCSINMIENILPETSLLVIIDIGDQLNPPI